MIQKGCEDMDGSPSSLIGTDKIKDSYPSIQSLDIVDY